MILIAILGVGNDWRADDGAGRMVARRLQHLAGGAFVVRELDGEPARIVEAWDGVRHCVVVDAGWSRLPPGTVTRFTDQDLDRLADQRLPGSHGMGVGAAIGLGRALGRMPHRLEVFTIEGEDFTNGPGLSRAVEEAVERLVDELEQQLAGRMPI